MDIDRRLILGGLGLAAGAAAMTSGARAAAAAAAPSGILAALVPDSEDDQSATLQRAIDEAASRGAAVIIPGGSFVVGGVVPRPGTSLVGYASSTLRSGGSGVLLAAGDAHGITIEGLRLEGGLVSLAGCRDVTIRHCEVSGDGGGIRIEGGANHSITACRFAGLGGAALEATSGAEGLVLAQNLVDGAGAGLVVTGFTEGTRLAVIQGNLVRNIGSGDGKSDRHGCGIVVEADAAITGNVIEGAALCGILAGMGGAKRDVAILGNLLRQCNVGIGLSGDPEGGLLFVSQNMITGARNGAIRAMDGLKPIGPDLTRASAEAYPNLAVLQNVAAR